MKSPKLWLACLLACAAFSTSSCLAEVVGEVLGVKGSVAIINAGTIIPAAVGTHIESGAEVRTGKPGRVKLRFIDGSVLVVSDGSTLKVEKYMVKDGKRDAGFVLDIGLISQSVVPSSTGSWTVRTPTAVTAVRGTEYMVEVTGDKATAVNVQSGNVAVTPSSVGSDGTAIGATSDGHRKRSLMLNYEGLTVVLDRPDMGTVCGTDGQCSNSKPWEADRIQKMKDRCSGI